MPDDGADGNSSLEPDNDVESVNRTDADAVARIEPRVSPPDTSQPRGTRRRVRLSRRAVGISLAFAAIFTILGVDIFFIAKGTSQRAVKVPPVRSATPSGSDAAASAASSNAPAPSDFAPAAMKLSPEPSASTPTASDEPPASAFPEDGIEEEPGPSKPVRPKHFGTVQQAAAGSCSTASVDGLSRQIIDQVRCADVKAFALLPARSNLVLESHTFPYLESAARDHLLRVLDAHRNQTMRIHSALRTVAQQYLVWRWASGRRCGVQMATAPGDSNHETGRALDIANVAEWRPALEAEDFHWLGASDNVHFDFKSHHASPQGAPDILAFQRLWNRNHPDDRIAESGRYDSNTEQRLKKSPPAGFSVGPSCSKATRANAAKSAKSARH